MGVRACGGSSVGVVLWPLELWMQAGGLLIVGGVSSGRLRV
uniref:Uncharacterized protein n=1 Tax=Nonomuraea gerenzanensis TaxID=93944 RepID=A0A1M4ELI4_9ACTN|nr:hypothetical protein BN4615_P9216 [Nonomuraea gerenzanensis]